jgi:hypothetical protein
VVKRLYIINGFGEHRHSNSPSVQGLKFEQVVDKMQHQKDVTPIQAV